MTWLRNRVSHILAGADATTLCHTARRDTIDIAGYVLLVMSWIYHRFLTFCPAGFNTLRFSLSSRLARLGQQTQDNHHDRGLRLWRRLDALRFDKIRRQFWWTPYDDPQLQQMTPDWIKSTEEIRTWRPTVPYCVLILLSSITWIRMTRGDNMWWPKRHCPWYDLWSEHGQQHRTVTIEGDPNPRPI
ncbi:hypothetical protein AHAS_Ahas09G0103200 [Arachis hypogaea]